MLLGHGHDHPVAHPADARLGDVGEERAERIEVAGRDGVELVVVALGAAGRLTEPHGAHGSYPVGEHPRLVVLGLRAPFLGREQKAIEAGGHAGLLGRIRQEIAGDLLDRKPVKRLVVVEALDDVVAVGPDVARGVGVVADRVGKPHDVEPADRHPLAVVRAREEAFDEFVVGVGRLIVHKHLHLLWRRWQAGQVKREPADERAAISLGGKREAHRGQPAPEKVVDRMGVAWHRLFHRRHIGPVRLILGALLDPPGEQGFLGVIELLVRLRRRHDLVGISGEDPRDERALGGLARHDRAGGDRVIPQVEPEIGLTMAGVGAVARETVVGEERPDVAVKRDLLCRVRPGDRGQRGDEQPCWKKQQRDCTRSHTPRAAGKAVHHRITPLENTRFAVGPNSAARRGPDGSIGGTRQLYRQNGPGVSLKMLLRRLYGPWADIPPANPPPAMKCIAISDRLHFSRLNAPAIRNDSCAVVVAPSSRGDSGDSFLCNRSRKNLRSRLSSFWW